MRYFLERVTDPEIEVVTLAELKLHIREFSGVTDLDDELTGLIQGAREWVEGFTGAVLVDSTWRLSLERTGSLFTTDPDVGRVFSGAVGPTRDVYLRRYPILAITSLVTVDADGVETAVAAADYEVRGADSKWPMVVPINDGVWGSSNIRVTFRAGFADQTSSPQTGAEVVPIRFIQAMKLWCDAMHNKDEKMMSLLLDTAERIVRPEKADLGMA